MDAHEILKEIQDKARIKMERTDYFMKLFAFLLIALVCSGFWYLTYKGYHRYRARASAVEKVIVQRQSIVPPQTMTIQESAFMTYVFHDVKIVTIGDSRLIFLSQDQLDLLSKSVKVETISPMVVTVPIP